MGIFRRKKKKLKAVPILFGSCLFILLAIVLGGWYASKKLSSLDILNTNFVRNTVVKQIGERHEFMVDLMPTFLGFTESQTYLVLLLNNTELRPGGGFIGTYATVRVSEGKIDVLALDGTENLDRDAPDSWRVVPPVPIQEYLGLDRWYFRDSNWSPDFRVSAERAIDFYTEEGGVAANDIDGVVGITPTVLEEMLQIVGPVTVEGITFTSENVIEILEYQVEYNYKNQGIDVENRKKIIQPLLLAIMDELKASIFSSYSAYLTSLQQLVAQKHMLFFHKDPTVQSILETNNWAGRVAEASSDYLMWVDANLGALKTDHALVRRLSYEMLDKQEHRYVVKATMQYRHTGYFDWRTSRYITYARLYVPPGSELLGVEGVLQSGAHITLDVVDQGTELGKQWFGTMFSIGPQQMKTLSYTYLLPENVVVDDQYHLLVQKQLGTIDHTLTLDLDFATLLRTADPPEPEEEWYDGVYTYTTDLKEDRAFTVSL